MISNGTAYCADDCMLPLLWYARERKKTTSICIVAQIISSTLSQG